MSSVGLYSSWCLNKPFRTLFDCGDGCAQALKVGIFIPDKLFFSHSHIDHVAGLLSFCGLRNKTMGANDKPLTIYYPSGENSFDTYINMLDELIPQRFRKYDISWVKISSGDEVQIKKNICIKAFSTRHTKNSLGYVIRQKGTKVKEGIDHAKVAEILASGVDKNSVLEDHHTNLFAYTLDNCGFDIKETAGVHEIVLDATFLNPKDRDKPTHCTLEEARLAALAMGCKKAYFAHISPRYATTQEIEQVF